VKKTFMAFLVAILLVALCSCGKSEDTNNTSVTPSQSSTAEQGNSTGKEIGQGIYYNETYTLSGDSGDGLTPEDGAKRVAADVLPSELTDPLSGDQCIYISFDDLLVLDSAGGHECYIYSVATGTISGGFQGSDYTVQFRASVDYTENRASIYEDFRSTGNNNGGNQNPSSNTTQGDPGDTDTPNWWGTYNGDGFSIEIVNFNGESFHFAVSNLRNGEVVFEGTAPLYPDDDHMAEYGQNSFYLYDDYNAIDFLAPEGSEWDHLRGKYTRID